MSALRGFNWHPVFFGLFFVGIEYFAQAFLTTNEARGHINHTLAWMLLVPGTLLGCAAFPQHNQKALYRGHFQLFRCICENICSIAIFALSVTTLLVIVLSGADLQKLPPRGVRIQTIGFIVFFASSAYLILCGWFIWIRYVVKEDTIVSVNGNFLYPGTKFALYPWFRYDVELFDRTFGSLDNILLTIQCLDGVYQIIFSTSFAVDIEKASRTVMRAESFDTEKVSADIKERITAHLTEEAKHYTLGQFLKLERDAMRYEVRGMPFIWDGKAAVTIK